MKLNLRTGLLIPAVLIAAMLSVAGCANTTALSSLLSPNAIEIPPPDGGDAS